MLWQVNLSVTSRQIRSGQCSGLRSQSQVSRHCARLVVVESTMFMPSPCWVHVSITPHISTFGERWGPLFTMVLGDLARDKNSATSCQAASRSLPATVCMLLPVCQVENHHCPSFVGMFIIAHVTEVQANASWQVVHTRCPKLKRENRPGTSASLSSPILQHGCRE